MTNEFEQSALAYQKSSLEWQQRCNIAIAERDALRKELDAILTKRSQTVSVGAILAEVDTLRAERDALRDQWSDLLIEQARLMAMRDAAIAERDKLRTEVQRLRAMVDLTHNWREGKRDPYLPAGWTMYDALCSALDADRKAMEVQP